jgi:hypothetical protein
MGGDMLTRKSSLTLFSLIGLPICGMAIQSLAEVASLYYGLIDAQSTYLLWQAVCIVFWLSVGKSISKLEISLISVGGLFRVLIALALTFVSYVAPRALPFSLQVPDHVGILIMCIAFACMIVSMAYFYDRVFPDPRVVYQRNPVVLFGASIVGGGLAAGILLIGLTVGIRHHENFITIMLFCVMILTLVSFFSKSNALIWFFCGALARTGLLAYQSMVRMEWTFERVALREEAGALVFVGAVITLTAWLWHTRRFVITQPAALASPELITVTISGTICPKCGVLVDNSVRVCLSCNSPIIRQGDLQ